MANLYIQALYNFEGLAIKARTFTHYTIFNHVNNLTFINKYFKSIQFSKYKS